MSIKALKIIRIVAIIPFAIPVILGVIAAFRGVTAFETVELTGFEAFEMVIIAAVGIFWWLWLVLIGVVVGTSVAIGVKKRGEKKAE